MDALCHRRRRRPRPARGHFASPRPPAHLVRPPPINGCGVERGVGGGHGACARGGGDRPAAVGLVVPGGGELRGRRAVWRHGPSGGGTRIARCRAADSLPPRVTLARRDAPAGSRDRRLAQRRRTRCERRALPKGPCRGLHGQAHRRRVRKAIVVLGQRAPRCRSDPAPRRDQRGRVSRAVGRDRRRDHGGAVRGDVSGAGVGSLRHWGARPERERARRPPAGRARAVGRSCSAPVTPATRPWDWVTRRPRQPSRGRWRRRASMGRGRAGEGAAARSWSSASAVRWTMWTGSSAEKSASRRLLSAWCGAPAPPRSPAPPAGPEPPRDVPRPRRP